jgi:hypothetical protein
MGNWTFTINGNVFASVITAIRFTVIVCDSPLLCGVQMTKTSDKLLLHRVLKKSCFLVCEIGGIFLM